MKTRLWKRLAAAVCAAALAVGAALPAAAAWEVPISLANEDESIYLLNLDNGTVLLDKDSTQSRYIASLTKMMAALLVIESGEDLTQSVTIPESLKQEFDDIQAYNGADMKLKIGETVRLIDLLYGALVASANDAVSVLAWHFGGGDISAFVAQMNARAVELGCTGTNFTCAHGLYDAGNVSTAQDLAKIAKACRAQALYMQIAQTVEYTLPVTNLHEKERKLTTTNLMQLPGSEVYRAYIAGMKTGFTTMAGRCFVTTATRDGQSFLLVLLGSTKDAIYPESAALLDWAFDSFSTRVLLDMGDSPVSVPLEGGAGIDRVQLYAMRSVAGYGPTAGAVTYDFDVPELLQAPVKSGTVVGTVTVKLEGVAVDTVELVTLTAYDSAVREGVKNTALLSPVLALVLAGLLYITMLASTRVRAKIKH